MKKALLLLASAALLLVGCTKEKFEGGQVEGMTTVSFTASLESGAVTKAAVDGDGAADSVNRCIMEIYYGDELFARQYAPVNSDKKATFTAQVVSNRTYTVAFWADKVDTATTASGLATDKYYTTTSLKEITIKGSYVGNDDARDAFYHVGQYTVAQAGSSFGGGEDDKILLKRPFAQMNVITTDWDKASSVTGLAPEKVDVTIKNALAKFNAITGEVSGSQTLNYQAAVYASAANSAEKTLSMDYLFASADKAVIDIEWKGLHGADANVAHTFAAVPYQRNYRTNIKGALLTTQGQWTVTVDPAWTTPDYDVPYYVASSIEDAQKYIAPTEAGTAKNKVVDLSNVVPTADDLEDDGSIKFELKTTSPVDMVNFTLPAIPESLEGCTGWKITYEDGYPTKNVNVTAPEGTNVTIEAPESHVTLNGTTYEQVTATTGDGTLVVPAGVIVDNLIVKKGAVEIHGTVNALTVTPDEGEKVVFRACEGLSADVFAAIKGEGHDYIDSPMYAYKKVGEKYDIYKLPVVAMIGDAEYPSITAAVAAVPADNTQLVTINVMSDVVLKKADALTVNKDNVVLDGQDHTIALDENDEALAGYVDSKYGQFQMIKVSGKNVTLKNMTLDGNKYRGASLATSVGGEDVVYENIVYNGIGSAHYYSTKGNGLITFKNCKINTCGYAIHSDTAAGGIVIDGCEIHGWNAFGAAVASVSIKDSKFFSAEDSKNGTLAAFSIYCPTIFTNCIFSKEFAQAGTYEGIFMSAKALVSLNGCSVEGGELYQIARTDDEWAAGSVIAIDATGNATDGFNKGTFVATNREDIKVSPLSEIKPVEGKENVYTVAVKPVAKVGEIEYETLQQAFDAVPDGVETTVTLIANAKTATLGDKDHIGAKTVVLNLNGHSITGYVRGISTLTNSNSLDGATLVNFANLTINGEGIIGDLEGEYHHNALVNMSDGTNLTINGGTFVAKSCCVFHYSASSEANTASLNVNGGTFSTSIRGFQNNKNVFGIAGKSGQTLTFNYKNATTEGVKGVYCSLAGTTINIHSGSITADINAVYLSMGKKVTINIDGGILKTLDSENHANNYMSNGAWTGSSLPIYASAFGSENIVCNISGGDFIYPYYSSNGKPSTWERVINAGEGITTNVANTNVAASLTGGTYSTNQMLSDITNDQSKASGIVAQGYTCQNNGDGTWTVVAEN